MIVNVKRTVIDQIEAKCETCQYWIPGDVSPQGACHETSPTIQSDGSTAWPTACAGDSCGRFNPKE